MLLPNLESELFTFVGKFGSVQNQSVWFPPFVSMGVALRVILSGTLRCATCEGGCCAQNSDIHVRLSVLHNLRMERGEAGSLGLCSAALDHTSGMVERSKGQLFQRGLGVPPCLTSGEILARTGRHSGCGAVTSKVWLHWMLGAEIS